VSKTTGSSGAKYFPLVGIIVGGILAGVLLLAARSGAECCRRCLRRRGTALTGALHEDGWPTADGSARRSRKRALPSWKDSRIGPMAHWRSAFRWRAGRGACALPLSTGAAALIARTPAALCGGGSDVVMP